MATTATMQSEPIASTSQPAASSTSQASSQPTKPKKRFIGRKPGTRPPPSSSSTTAVISTGIPQSILEDKALNAAIAQLPSNYSFEIHKTIWQVRKNGARMVALQMPEGLQMFACLISDIIERFTDALTVIMGDVTYGACCIDDYTALALGCDMLIHYGHSCLVPVDTTTSIKTLYVFVEIAIDNSHLSRTVRLNFPDRREGFRRMLREVEERERGGEVRAGDRLEVGVRHLAITAEGEDDEQDGRGKEKEEEKEPTTLALVSTIQFVAAVQALKEDLTRPLAPPPESADLPAGQESALVQASDPPLHTGTYNILIPRSKPLSPGEILGCTAPSLPANQVDAILYVGDGRFHLESIMIANPAVPAFRYDPYSKKLTRERYAHGEMRRMRGRAVDAARKSLAFPVPTTSSITSATPSSSDEGPGQELSTSTAREAEDNKPGWGLILGTLGRQGNLSMLRALSHQLSSLPPSHQPDITPILLSELSPQKLALFPQLSAFVQTSCPRLSIDWGEAFGRPLLSPYECGVAVGGMRRWGEWDDRALAGAGGKGEVEVEEGYRMDFYDRESPWAKSRATGRFVEV